jgi:hypothetical protein
MKVKHSEFCKMFRMYFYYFRVMLIHAVGIRILLPRIAQ